MEVVGGRSIHPINVRIGGFYSVPTRADLAAVAEEVRRALDGALATVTWVAGFDFPDLTVSHELLALTGERYPSRTAPSPAVQVRPSRSPNSASTSARPRSCTPPHCTPRSTAGVI